MAHAILMPKPGQMTEECTVIAWHKKEGDPVKRGDVLFEIETDKSAMEVEAFDDGVLLKIVAAEGQTVPVNTVCAYVGQPGEAIPEAAPAVVPAPAAVPPAPTPAPRPAVAPAPPVAPEAAPAAAPAATGDGRLRISPRASRAAAEAGVDPRTIAGTGPEGRITERDVLAAIQVAAASPAAAVAAAPRVGPAPAAPGFAPAPAPAPLSAITIEGQEEPRPLNRMRRVIADRLTQSWTSTPHFTVTVAVDVTGLLALRAELKAGGTNLTVTDFVLAATAQTLAEFPDVNSRTDGASVWPRRRVHLGLAVSVPAGLVVPVIRDADRLGLGELHDRAAALAGAGRDGTLPIDDMTGSTFTVSNLGMFGVDEFSAIINPGEAAILAVASAIPTVVAVGDAMGIRSILKLTLSADHRLVDGEMGARFLNAIRRRLEDVAAFRNEALNG
jgi:pyruvate dehydrogenase E2 component (dihydrolipoamide acetyltransferase)